MRPVFGPTDNLCRKRNCVIVIVDIAESVRLIDQDEDDAIRRWLALVAHCRAAILPASGGRLVKSIGDGMLIEFEHVVPAITAAFAIQHASCRDNIGKPPSRHILLRMGIELGDVIVTDDDLLGSTANRAARLAALAGPGEIVVSQNVHQRLEPMLGADIHAYGPCFLRHLSDPQPAFRVGPASPNPVVTPSFQATSVLPTVAVLPPRLREVDSELDVFADSYATSLVRHLTRFPDLEVVFRQGLSRADSGCDAEMNAHLSADFVLSAGCSIEAGRPVLEYELAEAKSGRILLAKRFVRNKATLDCFTPKEACWLALRVRQAVLQRVLHRIRSESPVTLKSPILLAGAIGLIYRLSAREFEHARHLLQTIIDRSRGQCVPLAWLANWHVLRVQQGWSPDPLQDGLQALEYTKAALDADPNCALALAVNGLVCTNLLKRLDLASKCYDLAIAADPDNGLAWLWRGTMYAFMGEGARAMEDTARALSLAPTAPYSYYFDSLAATAYLTASRYDLATTYATRSLRANQSHTSTLRVLAVAQMGLNRGDESRRIVARLRRLEPTLTVRSYLQRTPAADFQIGQDCATTLGQAGLPN